MEIPGRVKNGDQAYNRLAGAVLELTRQRVDASQGDFAARLQRLLGRSVKTSSLSRMERGQTTVPAALLIAACDLAGLVNDAEWFEGDPSTLDEALSRVAHSMRVDYLHELHPSRSRPHLLPEEGQPTRVDRLTRRLGSAGQADHHPVDQDDSAESRGRNEATQ